MLSFYLYYYLKFQDMHAKLPTQLNLLVHSELFSSDCYVLSPESLLDYIHQFGSNLLAML